MTSRCVILVLPASRLALSTAWMPGVRSSCQIIFSYFGVADDRFHKATWGRTWPLFQVSFSYFGVAYDSFPKFYIVWDADDPVLKSCSGILGDICDPFTKSYWPMEEPRMTPRSVVRIIGSVITRN